MNKNVDIKFSENEGFRRLKQFIRIQSLQTPDDFAILPFQVLSSFIIYTLNILYA